MTIYVLVEGSKHEGGGEVGVYTDLDLARAHLQELVDLENAWTARVNRVEEDHPIVKAHGVEPLKLSYLQPSETRPDWFESEMDYMGLESYETDVTPGRLKDERERAEPDD